MQHIHKNAEIRILKCETTAAKLMSKLLKKNTMAIQEVDCNKCAQKNIDNSYVFRQNF